MAQIAVQDAFNLALQQHHAGRLPEAERLYRQILSQHPNHCGAMHYLGVMANQMGQSAAAVDLIRRAIAISPNDADAHCNLGVALMNLGHLDEAIISYRHAIALQPGLPQAYSNLGNVLTAAGQLDQAIAACQQALALRPNYAEAYSNLGNALTRKGQIEAAMAALQHALALRPDVAEVHYNLANALAMDGKIAEAIGSYQNAIALNPNSAQMHGNLGIALRENGQLDESLAAYRQAIALNPNLPQIHSHLGIALKDAGRLDEAIAAYRRAIALDPNDHQTDSNFIYALHFHPDYDSGTIADEHRRWNRQHAEPLRKFIQNHVNERQPDRRLRIGYVSPDFRDHCQSLFTTPLLSHHDHEAFEIFCYSDVSRSDHLTQTLRGYADTWRSTAGSTDSALTEQIRSDSIDILVDLTMHMARSRLGVFARKPAPVQVTWLAYPGTTGLDTIDYRLSDPFLDPPGMDESIYSEQTVRLPDSFWCYDPGAAREIPVNALPAAESGIVTFGCLNNFCKINDGVLALWAQALREVPNSRLLLLSPVGSHRQHTLERLRQDGIDAERVEFMSPQSRQKYLEQYHRIDLGLDTFPYNGHTTSLDSYWMGVPVVTMLGERAVGRAGWCQLSNLGLQFLAAPNAEQFVRIATELATDLPKLRLLRSTLRQRLEQSPLMDAPKFARNIEAAFRQMWHSWCEAGSRKT